MSSSRIVIDDEGNPKLPVLPKFPDYFQKELLAEEYGELTDGYSVGETIWYLWNFFQTLRIGTLFIYKFIDNPLVESYYQEYPNLETRIQLARKTLEIPTLFFRGTSSQTPNIVFTDPDKTYFLQHLITSCIQIKDFAKEVNGIFIYDAVGVSIGINATLFKEFIKKVNVSFSGIEQCLNTLKNTLFYADSAANGDVPTYYLRIFDQFVKNNEVTPFLEYEERSEEIWEKYEEKLDEEFVSTVTSEIQEQNLVTYKKRVERFFYGLLISSMAVFNTFKNAVKFPVAIDNRIASFQEKYQKEKRSDEKSIINDRKLVTKRMDVKQLHERIAAITDLVEGSPERIKSSRNLYYEINSTLECIFYIFRHIVEDKQINRNEKIKEIIDQIEAYTNNKKVVTVVAAPAQGKPVSQQRRHQKYEQKKAGGTPASSPTVTTSETPSTTPTANISSSTASLDTNSASIISDSDAKKDEKPDEKPETIVVDPKVIYQSCYDECVATLRNIEDLMADFDVLHDALFLQLGMLTKVENLEAKLRDLHTRIKPEVENVKNRLKRDFKINFEEKPFSEELQKKLTRWKIDLDKLAKTMSSFERNIKQVNADLTTKTSRTKQPSKRERKAAAHDKLRERAHSDNIPRERKHSVSQVTLIRSISDTSASQATVASVSSPTSNRVIDVTPSASPKKPRLRRRASDGSSTSLSSHSLINGAMLRTIPIVPTLPLASIKLEFISNRKEDEHKEEKKIMDITEVETMLPEIKQDDGIKSKSPAPEEDDDAEEILNLVSQMSSDDPSLELETELTSATPFFDTSNKFLIFNRDATSSEKPAATEEVLSGWKDFTV